MLILRCLSHVMLIVLAMILLTKCSLGVTQQSHNITSRSLHNNHTISHLGRYTTITQYHIQVITQQSHNIRSRSLHNNHTISHLSRYTTISQYHIQVVTQQSHLGRYTTITKYHIQVVTQQSHDITSRSLHNNHPISHLGR